MSIKRLLFSVAFIGVFSLIALFTVIKVNNNSDKNTTANSTENLSPGKHVLSAKFSGKLRRYIVQVPSSYSGQETPLVFSLHGGGSNAEQQMSFNDLTAIADKESFIVVFPNAIGGNWNDGRSYTAEKSGNSDDVGFIRSIIENLSQKLKINSTKIYSAGISNGGMMSLRLACEASDVFAAVAAVAATMPEELKQKCFPSKPVSVLEIQGNADPLVPYNGGEIKGVAGRNTIDRGVLLSAFDSTKFWWDFNKCKYPDTITSIDDTDPKDGTTSSQSLHDICDSGTQVGLITVSGGGHTWPGGQQYLSEKLIGKTSQDFSASQVIWKFFNNKTI